MRYRIADGKEEHMKNFDIIMLEKLNIVLVLILDCESPFDHLQEIVEELKRNKYEGTVVFDELLHSGNNDERFIICNFADRNFVTDSFQFYSVPKQHMIRGYMNAYLKRNSESLRVSGLGSHQIGLIEKGCVV